MATATSSRGSDDDLLEPFLEALASPQPISIPTETLLGAITHFLSTIPKRDVPRLARGLIHSPTLWTTTRPRGIREAISLAVKSKMGTLQARYGDSWFPQRRVSSSATQWMATLVDAIQDQALPASHAATHCRLGLLYGMSACTNQQWSDTRSRLEEDVILALAGMLSDPESRRQAYFTDLLCAALAVVSPDRLRVLGIESCIPLLQAALFNAVERDELGLSPHAIAGAISRCLELLTKGSSGLSTRSLALMEDGARSSEYLAERLVAERAPSKKGKERESSNERRQSLLQAALLPLSSIINILLRDLPHSSRSPRLVQHVDLLARSIIFTLDTISACHERSAGGSDELDRILCGSLDLVAATCGPVDIRRLFRQLMTENTDASQDAFVLRCGELLVSQLDGHTVTELLLPLCERCLHDPNSKPGFESAHAFMLAVISAVSRDLERPFIQEAFAQEITPYYSRVLLKHFKRGLISAAQFTASYLIVCELASKLEGDVLDTVIWDLLPQIDLDASMGRTLLAVSIAAGQYVSRSRLRLHLDDIATRIMIYPVGEDRLDLVAKAFTLVAQDLPDDRKSIGRIWWVEWKERLLGRHEDDTSVRAKL